MLRKNIAGHGGAVSIGEGTILSKDTGFLENVADSDNILHAFAHGGAIKSWESGQIINIYIIGEHSVFKGNTLIINEGEHSAGKAMSLCCSDTTLNLINTNNNAFESMSDIYLGSGTTLQNVNADNPLYTQYCVDKPNNNEGVVCENLPPPCSILRSGNFTIYEDCVMYYEIIVTGKLNVTGVPDAQGNLPKIIGGGSNRFFKVESGGELVVTSLNLTGGIAGEEWCQGYTDCSGGAINVEGGKLNTAGCVFWGNKGYRGGAIWLTGGGSVYLFNSSILHNVAVDLAAVYVSGACTLNVFQTKIEHNVASCGAAVACEKTPHCNIASSFIRFNTGTNSGCYSGYGAGALWMERDTVAVIVDTVVVGNTAPNGGNAIFTYADGHGVPVISLLNVYFEGADSILFAGRNYNKLCNGTNSFCGTESCTDAPTQCQDNGFPASYVCADKPNQNEGVLCKPPCSISTSGRFTISQDCIQATQIYVVDFLEVVGIPSADGKLPKVHGGGSNRFFELGSDYRASSLILSLGFNDNNILFTEYFYIFKCKTLKVHSMPQKC